MVWDSHHLGFILFGTLWVSRTWAVISFPILGKCSTIISSSVFSWPFFCLLLLRLLWFECWGVLPWVYPVWNSLGFLDLGDSFLPHFREVFNYYLLKYFLMVFLLSSSSGTPMIWMLGHLTLSQRSLRLSSFLLILFFLFSSLLHLFPRFCLLTHLHLLSQLFSCWFPLECFWSVIALFIIDWLFYFF